MKERQSFCKALECRL